jgi:hypothetical protein
MKTLDAIQLASARLSLADVFITSYKKLYDIAMQELSGECIYICVYRMRLQASGEKDELCNL